MSKQYSVKSNKKGMDVLESKRRKRSTRTVKTYAPPKKETVVFEISPKTIFLLLAVAAGIYFGGKLLQVFVLVFFAFIISSAALPGMRWLMDKGVSKAWSIALVYFVGLVLLVGSLLLILIPTASELSSLVTRIPELTEQVLMNIESWSFFGNSVDLEYIRNYVVENSESLNQFVSGFDSWSSLQSIFEAGSNFVGMFAAFITSLIISVYILIDHDSFLDIVLLRIIDEKKRMRVSRLIVDVEDKLGKWVLGQGMLSVIMGVLVYIALTILGVPFGKCS
jgi:predicted PurR-regulated permease PerM